MEQVENKNYTDNILNAKSAEILMKQLSSFLI